MKRVALIFRGGVSKRSGNTHKSYGKYDQAEHKHVYINFASVEKGLRKNLIENNPNYEIDYFIHSWNPDLAEDLEKLYMPKASQYEPNSLYYDELSALLKKCQSGYFGTASQYISLRNGIDLLEKYVEQNKKAYDLIISWRLDVLLYNPVNLDSYNGDLFYVNGDPNGTKDLDIHFVTGYDNRHLLKEIYQNIDIDCAPEPHKIIVKYFNKIGKSDLLTMDEIIYRKDNEMVRALIWCYQTKVITKEQLESYGLTIEDISACVP